MQDVQPAMVAQLLKLCRHRLRTCATYAAKFAPMLSPTATAHAGWG